ncbi:MAG: Flp pilus assembly complex ATPase component TadA, partial [Spirochaetales bacterium]|nr:Flp pilus assembly complex ATPase component TadA [Spirochaetales bacterium]
DPDIIMVGEMRDSGTAEIAVRAALTGHLVFSTLHTNDAVSVINRLKNMGIETYLIAGVLRGAVAQRLVRKICPDCRETVKMNLSQRKIFEKNGFTADSIYEGKGCKLCNGTGYKGRIAVAELFCMDRKIEEMIINEETTDTILSYLDKKGMKTVLQSGLDLVVKGLTTIEEVERVVEL